MLKMTKYEYRKNIFPLLIVFIVFACLEVYFVAATLLELEAHSTIAMTLLMLAAFCSYIFVLLYGVISYSADLKNKSGYLVFMAPISSYKVIGAKLLSTLLIGIVLVALIILLTVVDYSLAAQIYGFESLLDMLKELLSAFGYSMTQILINVLAYVLVMLIEFFMIITVAYFAISLCSTVLQNKKSKGFVSFLLFIVLIVIISIIAAKLPRLYEYSEIDTFLQSLYASLPQLILYVVCMVGSFIGSGLLLDKKISL